MVKQTDIGIYFKTSGSLKSRIEKAAEIVRESQNDFIENCILERLSGTQILAEAEKAYMQREREYKSFMEGSRNRGVFTATIIEKKEDDE